MSISEASARLRTITHDYGEQHATLTVQCERTEFILQASPWTLTFPKEDLNYHQLRKVTPTITGPAEYRATQESLRTALLMPFLPIIKTLATPFEPGRDLTIHEFAVCNRFILALQPDGEILVTEQKHGPLAHGLISPPMPTLTIPSTIPHFDAREVTLDSCDPIAAATWTWPDRASTPTAGGKTKTQFFLKAALDLRYPEFAHELATYITLHNLDNPIPRVPVLEGVVVTSSPYLSEFETPEIKAAAASAAGPFILGFLIIWIDGAVILADVSRRDRGLHMERWRESVCETIEGLHSRSILWGDVNSHNVVVDREMGVWVVDFGRGGEGLYGGTGGAVGNRKGDLLERELDRGERRKLEMKKELEGVDAMMEALLPLGPEESQGFGPFYLHEG